jgi:ABC-2 type transport system permease protein
MTTTATIRLSARLFWQDKGALTGTVLTPVALTVGMPVLMRNVQADGVTAATQIFHGSLALVLALTTFTTIAMSLTARRDQLVLKRMRTTLLTRRQILTGEIINVVAQSVLLIALCTVAVHLLADVPLPRNPLLYAAFLVTGATVAAMLGAAYTALIPRVELAAVMTLPLFMLAGVGGGAMGPLLELLPEAVGVFFKLLPTDAVVVAARTAYAPGTLASDLDASMLPALNLAVWGAVAAFALTRWFRWEPRRS